MDWAALRGGLFLCGQGIPIPDKYDWFCRE